VLLEKKLLQESKEPTPKGHGIDLPLEGAVGYTMFKVTKVSKVSKVTKVKEFCLFYFYNKRWS